MDPQRLIWIDTQGSLTHIAAIFKFGDVSGPRAKKWPKVNHRLKEVKEALVATHHTFTTTYFQYVGQYVGPIFSLEKINEYFWYHPEIFLGILW